MVSAAYYAPGAHGGLAGGPLYPHSEAQAIASPSLSPGWPRLVAGCLPALCCVGGGAGGQSLPENEELYEGISCAVLKIRVYLFLLQ